MTDFEISSQSVLFCAISFVGTYLEDNAQRLMVENIAKNLSDADEYPAMISMQQRCVSILAHLWNVQPGEKAVCYHSAKLNPHAAPSYHQRNLITKEKCP